MIKNKELSNPFSTGGGGGGFEVQVQALFVTLMLTGGYAPCLPCWPITHIRLQVKIYGFETDDFIVTVEDPVSKEKRNLLGQIKHSITFTKGSGLFKEVIQAAWADFNNPDVFTRKRDIIALITGPLSKTDVHNMQWLLNQARCTDNIDDFFRRVKQAHFSPPQSIEKLDAIQYHLRAANDNQDVTRDELYSFLKHFHVLGYDLGGEYGVVLPLLHSHISQFHQQYPKWAWSRIVDTVQKFNQHAGTITPNNLPDDLLEAFKPKVEVQMPEELKVVQVRATTVWTQHPDATYLALAILIGAWQDNNQCDREVITQLLGISYDEWLRKAQEILQYPDSPLFIKNGTWKVVNRVELWNQLGIRILDHNLDTFIKLSVKVLKERDPAFELPAESRMMAIIYNKIFNYSHELRSGITDGLAILANQPEACTNCSQWKVEDASVQVVRELMTGADWVLWGSLDRLLPTLAEAAPEQFMDAFEKAVRMAPCPFDELFSQENGIIGGRNYLTGLLWALEVLAWDEQYLVRVCVALGKLASHYIGGNRVNHSSRSLITILLPWHPQTLASAEKRMVAMKTLYKEYPVIGWDLLLELLPEQRTSSFGSYKPIWRRFIPDNWKNEVTRQEYLQQVSDYAKLAVDAAGQNSTRLCILIDHFDNLPAPAFEQLIQTLASQPILEFPEEHRLLIWNSLMKFINKHRRFSDATWALPDEPMAKIEQVAKQLAPTNPFLLYQRLFTDCYFDLLEKDGDLDTKIKILEMQRNACISEIFQNESIAGVIRFAESISYAYPVGCALATIDDYAIEQNLFPHFLGSKDKKHKELMSGFIWFRYFLRGWKWCDGLDRSDWTPTQIGQFLACLPFNNETWDCASKWLQTHEDEYWTHASAHLNRDVGVIDITIAIEKLMEYGRPHVAIRLLDQMHQSNLPIDSNQCVHALLAALSSSEPSYELDKYHILELIKFLQTEPSVNQDDLFRVEWNYISLLDRYSGAPPLFLEHKLANDPMFFCEIVRCIYRSSKEEPPLKEPSEESRAIAENAWTLLDNWRIPPGTQKEGTFSEDSFTSWVQTVKETCTESGHLDVALINIGRVLIHSLPDPNGLWIRNIVAEALNTVDADVMRDSFSMGVYNARGAHIVDPTGMPERELAESFRRKAEEVENAGFHRFAATLRNLSNNYNREASKIINDNKERK